MRWAAWLAVMGVWVWGSAVLANPATTTMVAGAAATQPTATTTTTTPSSTATDVSDDFAPGLLAFVVLFFMVIVALIGAGAVAAVIAAALTGAMMLAGVISLSLVIGILRRSAATAARAFIFQIGALVGTVAGAASALALKWSCQAPWSVSTTGVVGAGAGLFSGLIVAGMIVFVATAGYRYLHSKYENFRTG